MGSYCLSVTSKYRSTESMVTALVLKIDFAWCSLRLAEAKPQGQAGANDLECDPKLSGRGRIRKTVTAAGATKDRLV